jgi:hypothetical protein
MHIQANKELQRSRLFLLLCQQLWNILVDTCFIPKYLVKVTWYWVIWNSYLFSNFASNVFCHFAVSHTLELVVHHFLQAEECWEYLSFLRYIHPSLIWWNHSKTCPQLLVASPNAICISWSASVAIFPIFSQNLMNTFMCTLKTLLNTWQPLILNTDHKR